MKECSKYGIEYNELIEDKKKMKSLVEMVLNMKKLKGWVLY